MDNDGGESCEELEDGCNWTMVQTMTPSDLVTSRYQVGVVIGDGNFAVVHEVRNKLNGAPFALKIIDKAKCRGKEAMIANEVNILRKVRHAAIIQLVEDFDSQSHLYLVMELVKVCVLFTRKSHNNLLVCIVREAICLTRSPKLQSTTRRTHLRWSRI